MASTTSTKSGTAAVNKAPVSSIADTITRSVVLYLTTLFSLDTITAARQSPFSITNPQISDSIKQGRRGDFGEGHNVGRRLDPGGATTRRGGFSGSGSDGDINVPVNKNCPLNGTPQIG